MNRRGFLRGLMCGAATVAVGMRLSHAMPSLEDGVALESAAHPQNAWMALAEHVRKTKEKVGANVLNRAFADERTLEAQDLTEEALEELLIDVAEISGERLSINPTTTTMIFGRVRL